MSLGMELHCEAVSKSKMHEIVQQGGCLVHSHMPSFKLTMKDRATVVHSVVTFHEAHSKSEGGENGTFSVPLTIMYVNGKTRASGPRRRVSFIVLCYCIGVPIVFHGHRSKLANYAQKVPPNGPFALPKIS